MLNKIVYDLLCLVFRSLSLCDSSILLYAVVERSFSGLHNTSLAEYKSSIVVGFFYIFIGV